MQRRETKERSRGGREGERERERERETARGMRRMRWSSYPPFIHL